LKFVENIIIIERKVTVHPTMSQGVFCVWSEAKVTENLRHKCAKLCRMRNFCSSIVTV